MRVTRALAAASCLVALAVTAPSRAELRDDAARIAQQWRAAGGKVLMGPPRFLSDDETLSLAVPALPEAECATVMVLGARGLSFHARVAGGDQEDDTRVSSIGGALVLSRCGGAPIQRVVVTSDAGRGAIETIAASSRAPLPGLRVLLPERTGGQTVPAPEPGELPALPAVDKRADTAEQRVRREGALSLPRETWRAGADGAGAGRLALEPGCHRIELFAQDPRAPGPQGGSRRAKLDLDAELRDEENDRLLARDRTDAPDAHLGACVGEATNATLPFAGAPGGTPVLVAHAFWPIPQHLPSDWGPDARARMANALLTRHLAAPRGAPVLRVQGGAGVTPVPVAVEAGGCYLAVAAVVQGAARGIGLRALVGARDASDDRGSSDSAGAVAFCTESLRRALIEVDARGTSLSWALVLFRVQSAVWESGR